MFAYIYGYVCMYVYIHREKEKERERERERERDREREKECAVHALRTYVMMNVHARIRLLNVFSWYRMCSLGIECVLLV